MLDNSVSRIRLMILCIWIASRNDAIFITVVNYTEVCLKSAVSDSISKEV